MGQILFEHVLFIYTEIENDRAPTFRILLKVVYVLQNLRSKFIKGLNVSFTLKVGASED